MTQTRQERATRGREVQKRVNRKLPTWWKTVIIVSTAITGIVSFLYGTGMFNQGLIAGCIPKPTVLDTFLSDAMSLSAVIMIGSVIMGIAHLEKEYDDS